MQLTDAQRHKIADEAHKLYQSASNFHWLTGAPTLMLDSLASQYAVLNDRMEAIRKVLSELQREADAGELTSERIAESLPLPKVPS